MMPGAEYLTTAVMLSLWAETGKAFATEQAEAKTTVQDFLRRLNPAWNVMGKVHFNLAENRKDEQAPFAFLATYTAPPLGAWQGPTPAPRPGAARVRGRGQQAAAPVAPAPGSTRGRTCAWLKQMVDAGEIFHPLRWSPQEAFRLLGDVSELERAGVVIRMPATWRAGRPHRPQATATVGSKAPSALGRMRCSTSAWRSRLTATG